MRLLWTEPAAEDLYVIRTFIAGDSPAAARRVAKTIFDGCKSLMVSPYRGRKGVEPGTRELVFAPLPYIAAYRVSEGVVEILHIWHGAQDR